MISYLYLENFKSIARQRFEFSKINVFCGPNNSGKSTVLSALNLVAQTIHDNPTEAPLVLNGKYDDLGTYYDLVHGHNPRSKIVIEFGIGKYSFRYEYKYRTQRREVEITGFNLKKENKAVYSYESRKNSYEIRYQGISSEAIQGLPPKKRPVIRGMTIYDPNMRYARLRRHSNQSQLDLPGVEEKKNEKLMESLASADRDMFHAFSSLRHAFSNFDSLGAFREKPTRTYMFSGESPKQVGRTGASAIDMLVSDSSRRGSKSQHLVEKTSKWFQTTNMSSGMEIKTLTPRHYELCIQDEAGRSHNICDVGFGCAQVLPVLVAAFSFQANLTNSNVYRSSEPILVIQEPEIHLHPNAQADLGSLFADICSEGGQVFIETHSPYLILRLQAEAAKKTILFSSLAIFYVKRKRGNSHFSNIGLRPDGMFSEPWPEGFFPHRHTESLNLARLSSQARNKKASE